MDLQGLFHGTSCAGGWTHLPLVLAFQLPALGVFVVLLRANRAFKTGVWFLWLGFLLAGATMTLANMGSFCGDVHDGQAAFGLLLAPVLTIVAMFAALFLALILGGAKHLLEFLNPYRMAPPKDQPEEPTGTPSPPKA